MTNKNKMEFVINELLKKIENPVMVLDYCTDYQLMIAVILSAQCTDDRVNIVTKELFKVVKTPKDLYNMSIDELTEYIKSVNYFNTKAKNLKLNAKMMVEEFDCVIPKSIDQLTKLPGVGRKTANVILHELYNISEGIVVDTHVKRLAINLGFTKSNNPEIIEKDLMKITDKKYWKILSHLFILHGRQKCVQKNLECSVCDLFRGKK